MKNQKLSQLNREDRPVFHLTPEAGWLNDPNGFSLYEGEYHMFYQCYPLDTHWGPTRWGHAKSKDFILWERLPIALTPDRDYDIGGCFSGTAIELEPDHAKAVNTASHMLMYTGRSPDPKGENISGIQTQCIAFGNGRVYEKNEGNPVITGAHLPEGGSLNEFRDPKLIQNADGTFRAMIANHNAVRGPQILLYRSENGLDWEYVKVLFEDGGKSGWMYECPDFFKLGKRHILCMSVMGSNQSICIIGDYDEQQEAFAEISRQVIDQGIDFYAGQTVHTQDGRQVLIGWMQNPETAEERGIDFPINGQMSVPRELQLDGDSIKQKPVRELEAYRTDEIIYKDVKLGGLKKAKLDGIEGRVIDMELSIRPDGTDVYELFRMQFAGDGEHFTEFTYKPKTGEAVLDRSQSGPGCTQLVKARTKVRDRNGSLKIRLLLDRLSAEIFINDGEQVMSAVIYTDRQAEDITFYVKGAAMMDIVKYRIKENK